MDNEFEQAIQDVLDYGMEVIDKLTPEQLKLITDMFGENDGR
jgi:hypothetical protein